MNNQGTSNYLSKKYNIPLKTVKTWVYKINKHIDITKDDNYKKDRKKEENVKPKISNRHFKAEKPNQKWATDITYLIYKDQKLYLSTILCFT